MHELIRICSRAGHPDHFVIKRVSVRAEVPKVMFLGLQLCVPALNIPGFSTLDRLISFDESESILN